MFFSVMPINIAVASPINVLVPKIKPRIDIYVAFYFFESSIVVFFATKLFDG
jgi:hypothetical protein